MWKDYVEGITATTSSTQIWRTIRSIDGRRPPSKDNEVLEVNRTYVEDGDKAKEIAKTYKGFSLVCQFRKKTESSDIRTEEGRNVVAHRKKVRKHLPWRRCN